MMPFYPDPADAPWALLARHLATQATADERRALREWVRADPTHLQILTTVTRAWERAGEAQAGSVLFTPAEVEAAWQRFRPLLAGPVPVAAPAPTPAPAPVVRPLWPVRAAVRWQLAAGLALLVGAAYALTERFVVRHPVPTVAYVSGPGRRVVHLPDGSTVWLNARSRLRYTGLGAGASHGTRAVSLTGEAFFEVVPNLDRPFLVSTATARMRVTGTAFNVRAFAAEDSVVVSVTRGQVWLLHPAAADSVLLAAGTRAALHAADAPGRVATALRCAPLTDYNFRAWQTDTLRFQDVAVARVARALQATFGTTVRIASAGLARCRFTGTFARPQPAQVLAVLAAATASRLSADGGGYVLTGPGCAAPADSVTMKAAL
ncbi:hypothetical protein A0257_11755 [Hymenobacter psoromatis]|nr:hypothetical protein A0257_11755 [Hymenobacter psoromatis]